MHRKLPGGYTMRGKQRSGSTLWDIRIYGADRRKPILHLYMAKPTDEDLEILIRNRLDSTYPPKETP